jgi:hypothetical protein
MEAIRLPGYDGIQAEENLITNYANNCPNCSACLEISSLNEPWFFVNCPGDATRSFCVRRSQRIRPGSWSEEGFSNTEQFGQFIRAIRD